MKKQLIYKCTECGHESGFVICDKAIVRCEKCLAEAKLKEGGK